MFVSPAKPMVSRLLLGLLNILRSSVYDQTLKDGLGAIYAIQIEQG